MIRVAVDAMGGDFGPSVTLPACLAFLDSHPEAGIVLVGQPDVLAAQPQFSRIQSHPRCQVLTATEVVTMDDPIEVALRRKKDTSMRVAIAQVKDGRAQAAVSAGNTGALMAIARYVLKTLDGIDRPAIATQLPNAAGGATTVLDLGANIDCTEEHLFQFAVMGSALVSATGKANPTVGLLNIGEEAIKGSEVIKKTGELLRSAAKSGDLNFCGNVEGNDIFKGRVDIVVCDGFVGNVALKASEGVASMIGGFIKAEFSRNIFTKIAAFVAYPVLTAFKNRVDHRRYNGAALLGLRGLVFKSHGSADAFGFERALNRAYDAARNNLLDRVQERIAHAAPLLAKAALGQADANGAEARGVQADPVPAQ
jgi:glycerol-3-phosphate acyltransferase PlsX